MSDLKQLLEEYDRTGSMPVPVKGYSSEDMESYERAGKLKEIIESVKSSLTEQFAEYGELKINITLNDESSSPIFNAINFEQAPLSDGKTDLSVKANLNVSRLAKLPSMEAYAAVYYPLYDSILKNVEKNKGDKSQEGKLVKVGEENQQSSESDSLIVSYLKEFLRNLFGVGTELKGVELDDFSVQSIAKDFSKKGITRQDFFENPNGTNLLAERFAKVSKQGYQQQATALLGEFSKNEINLISGTDAEIKAFCEKFADNFLKNSGLQAGTYAIEFTNTGDIGLYSDKGDSQSIKINIDAIRKMYNPAEVLMTLAHELTHMVDSSVNKGLGQASRKGYGLTEHNLVGGVNKNSSGFLKRMEEVYYKANPHERSARQGELVALEFMMGMQPNATMKSYIEKSLASFKGYQVKTIKALQVDVEKLIADYNNGNSQELQGYDEKTLAYISKVMDDLMKMKSEGLLDFSSEIKNLEDATKISESMNAVSLGE